LGNNKKREMRRKIRKWINKNLVVVWGSLLIIFFNCFPFVCFEFFYVCEIWRWWCDLNLPNINHRPWLVFKIFRNDYSFICLTLFIYLCFTVLVNVIAMFAASKCLNYLFRCFFIFILYLFFCWKKYRSYFLEGLGVIDNRRILK